MQHTVTCQASICALGLMVYRTEGEFNRIEMRSNRSNDDVIDADHYQRAQFRLLHPQAAVDAIGPDIDPAVFVEALLVLVAILIRPDLLQAGYGAR